MPPPGPGTGLPPPGLNLYAEVLQGALHELRAVTRAEALEAEAGVDGVVGGDDAALLELLAAAGPVAARARRSPAGGGADGPAAGVGLEVRRVDVVPSLTNFASSTQVPRPSVPQSVITLTEISTSLPA